MILSFEQFSTYPEMNGGPPVNERLRAKVAALDLELASQSVPPTTTITYQPPAQRKPIWDNSPKMITTTTVLIPVTPTVILYKSAVQNPSVQVSQPKATQAEKLPPLQQ